MGIQARAGAMTGQLDPTGSYIENPVGAGEGDFEEDLVGTIRFLEKGQLSLLLPIVETLRAAPGLPSEFGGGVGDVNVGARWDFRLASEQRGVPGVALLLGLTAPTGVPPEQAKTPLAVDATGIGAFQGNVGLALEELVGRHLLVDASGLVSQRSTRSSLGVTSTLGTQLYGLLGAGWIFDGGEGLALLGTFTGERNATVDGEMVPDSGRSETTLSVVAGTPLGGDWRLQGSVYDVLQVGGLGRNEPVGPGATLVLIRSFL